MMDLSDFGSWASVISLIIGLITGFFACKKNNNKQSNINVANSGTSSQSNSNEQQNT